MYKFKYILSRDGYIILQDGESRLLLDTGAPFSFGQKLANIPGVARAPAMDIVGFSALTLSRAMDCHVDGVIGAETLLTQTIHIDPVLKEVTFSSSEIGAEQGVAIRHKMNVPMVDVEFDGELVSTIFDTGAPLGYVTRAMTQGRQPVATFDDFYPLLGAFQTEVFEIPVKIGEWEDLISFGVFPENIERMHCISGCPTIIGLGLLKNYGITIGLRERLMKLELLETCFTRVGGTLLSVAEAAY